MKFEKTEVFNFEGALRGARNPLESHSKSDSFPITYDGKNANLYDGKVAGFYIGENDLGLTKRLVKAGSSHRKFIRQIFICVDITAPLYWWKEWDQYKINVTTNSESTMHMLSKTKITSDCFERNDRTKNDNVFLNFINHLEQLRLEYLETKDKETWETLIQELPSSWLQKRTVTMNYENVLSIIEQRKNHKLPQWSIDFINWTKDLPYSNELLYIGGEE